MKGENLFLLAIVVIGGWWLFRDAAKQQTPTIGTAEFEAARQEYLKQQAQLQTAQEGRVLDYAEQLAERRRMLM